jgi:hypothetical protein
VAFDVLPPVIRENNEIIKGVKGFSAIYEEISNF